MLLVLAFACLAGAAFLLGEVATQPARQRREAVSRAASYGRTVVRRGNARPFKERALQPLASRIAETVVTAPGQRPVEAHIGSTYDSRKETADGGDLS